MNSDDVLYEQLAFTYDNQSRDRFSVACALLTAGLVKAPGPVCDLACGTGTLVQRLHNQGYEVTGVDRSEGMLQIAQSRYFRMPPPKWVREDILQFQAENEFAAVLCFGDVVNHLLEPAQVRALFRRAYQNLRPGGLFLFDTSTLATYRSSMWNQGPQQQRRGRDRIESKSWFDEPEGLGYLQMSVRRGLGRKAERLEETLVERYYAEEEVASWIDELDFQSVAHEDFHPLSELTDPNPMKTLWKAFK